MSAIPPPPVSAMLMADGSLSSPELLAERGVAFRVEIACEARGGMRVKRER